MRFNYLLFLAFTISLVACSPLPVEEADNDLNDPSLRMDAHSYSNTDDVRTKHLHLELDVNFKNNTIYGVVRHELDTHEADTIIFDIKNLDINKITLGKTNETEAEFIIGEFDPILGQPLSVMITPETKFVNIYYQTTDEAEALDWLPPSLTEGKEHPFLYTQGQAILTRSWIPVQDTPKNRITYSADVKVPSELMAIMSASNPTEKSEDGNYHFEMKQKIPAYLIALSVGDLAYISTGANCGVYAEPGMVQKSADEFKDLGKMIEAAEGLYGEYRWDQYDIVVLPYSFPFGGMENPRLSFINPTVIAGDGSLVSVIAHELAHSWSGNLVTNATWNDFWMNEGFTVYFENRIMEEIYGKDVADILALIEHQDLVVALDDIENSDFPEDSQLKLQLSARNPDEGMTDIAYVKGAYFLRTLESKVGRKTFDKFLENYFNKHAFETITTEDFLAYLEKELIEPNNLDFNAKEWIYEPGMPDNCVVIESERLDEMKVIAEEINKGNDPFEGEKIELTDRITQEWQTFIRGLSTDISNEKMNELESAIGFGAKGNPAIKSDWFLLAAKSGNKELRPGMEAYLMKIGRRWYIESIYEALSESEDKENLEWARSVYEKAKSNYHFVTRSTVEEILK